MRRVQPRIYFDSASTTNVNPDVLKTYEQLLEHHFANSESLYEEGAEVSRMPDERLKYAKKIEKLLR